MDLLAREKKIRLELEQVLARVLEQFAPDTTIADFNVNKITREFVKDSGIEELLNMACEYEYLIEYRQLEEKGLLHKAPLPNGTPIYLWQTNDVDEWFVYQDSYLYGVSEYYNGKLGEDFFLSEEECRNHSVS